MRWQPSENTLASGSWTGGSPRARISLIACRARRRRATSSTYIEALTYSGEPEQARQQLERAIAGMKRSRLVRREANYWRAEFTSALWRFVDDVEFLFDDHARRIDVRSASRVGYSDLGVNRKRIEEIRRRFPGQ